MDLLAAWRGCLDDCFAFFGTRLKERFLRSKAEVEAIMIHFRGGDGTWTLQAVAVVAVQDVGGHGPKCKRNKPSFVMFRCISLHTRKSRDGQEDQEGR